MLNTPLIILLQSVSQGVGSDLITKLGEWSAVIVIIAYLVFQLIRDAQRNKRESLKNSASLKFQNAIYQQLETSEKVNKHIVQYLKMVSLQYADEINEAQMRILIEKVLEASKYAIKSYISTIMRENHIEGNEVEIRAKIKQYVSNRYETDVLILKEYSYKGETLDIALCDEWPIEITKLMVGIVFTQKSEKLLATTLTNKFDEFKIRMLTLILNRKIEEE
jgi:hypothetical protein